MDLGADDDTIRIKRPAARRRTVWPFVVAALALIGAGAALVLLRPGKIAIGMASEASIDAAQPCAVTVSRLTVDPSIVVVDFPSLTLQGMTLNRVAALVEKAGAPRDRVLDDVSLQQAIRECGETAESYYYGHDYKAADLARFFALAEAGGITLNPQELWLKKLVRQLGWLRPGANGALITLPAANGPITGEMRAVILHHEISHGAFYTIPAYQHYAENFWASLTPADRAAFTNFLGRQGYDTNNTELMLNETQAYLIFTRDPLFFNGSVVGMSAAEISTLREFYIPNIPVAWLRPMADAPLRVSTGATVCD
jgi:hypothetical protein